MSWHLHLKQRLYRSMPGAVAGLLAAGILIASLISNVKADSIFANNVAPPEFGPEGGAEIGTYFTPLVDLTLTGFRWYAGPNAVANQSGTYTAKLWTQSDATLQEAVDFGTLVAGWNDVLLPSSVQLTANTNYVVSVNHHGFYTADSNGGNGYFPKGSAAVTATRSGFAGAGAFPSSGPFPNVNGGASYFVDIIFDSPLVTGDVNGDLHVDLTDFGIIRGNFFKTGQNPGQGDLNGTTVVDFDDFRIWKTAFLGAGGSLEAIGSIAIPEPSSVALCGSLLGMSAIMRRRWSVNS